uniref:Uncharacterized protein n=1 Tax=Monopterus albus TaxID=43700 RepID=A0A3Q3IGH6_MONAL
MEKQATLKEKLSIFGSRTAGRPMRCVSGADGAGYGLSKAEFMEKVQQSNEACQHGDFQAAVCLYSEALQADPQNCILYSNRSAALLKLGQHQAALGDAEKACELNPKWPKGTQGRTGLGITVSPRHVPVTHSETPPESEKDVGCARRPGGDDERDAAETSLKNIIFKMTHY